MTGSTKKTSTGSRRRSHRNNRARRSSMSAVGLVRSWSSSSFHTWSRSWASTLPPRSLAAERCMTWGRGSRWISALILLRRGHGDSTSSSVQMSSSISSTRTSCFDGSGYSQSRRVALFYPLRNGIFEEVGGPWGHLRISDTSESGTPGNSAPISTVADSISFSTRSSTSNVV